MDEKKVKKVNDYMFKVDKEGDMNVPVHIYASDKLMDKMKKDRCIDQGKNVATLPGILKASIMLSDAHQGYGFSIGGVAAFDSDTGIITPGGIGFDINCGVRVLTTNLTKEEVEPKIDEVLDELFKRVPCGVGKKSQLRLTQDQLDEVMINGAEWCVNNGYGVQEDLDNCESNGKLPGADPKKVSAKARGRGLGQLGTLGAGNHFLEIQYVDQIYDAQVAKKFGITKKDQVIVMIHCGSRGFGHQICSDYLRKMEDHFPDIMASLPEKDLIYAPYKSNLGQEYFAAMNCAGNYAWANRHMIGHHVKEGFKTIFGQETKLKTLYDVAHNIGKIESHEIEGKKRNIIVHRKGATRAFPKHHVDVPEKYRDVGQPVMIPGSMGTSSWILVGTEKGMDETFGSSVHGAGRVMSRNQANKEFRAETVKNDLSKQNITVKSASWRGISEEAPGVYKNVDEVVDVMKNAGISRPVSRLKPIGVIKG
jgi:tRNA-splicing ligase RtcB (3'-phosphate/5'-hydroxy nucleic acid ligase)